MSPLGCRWLAHGVLVSEQANLIHRPVLCNGIQPLHANKVLGTFGVVRGEEVLVRMFVPDLQMACWMGMNHSRENCLASTLRILGQLLLEQLPAVCFTDT